MTLWPPPPTLTSTSGWETHHIYSWFMSHLPSHMFFGKRFSSWLSSLKVEVGATCHLLHRKWGLCLPSPRFCSILSCFWYCAISSHASAPLLVSTLCTSTREEARGWKTNRSSSSLCPASADSSKSLHFCTQNLIQTHHLTQRWLLFRSRSMSSARALNNVVSAMTAAKTWRQNLAAPSWRRVD